MAQSEKYTASIEKVDNLSHIETIWKDLETSTRESIFITWSWIGPWAKLVINETDLYLYQLKHNNEIVALCFITLCTVKRMKGLISVKQVQINEFQANGCNMVIQYNDILSKSDFEGDAWKYLEKQLLNWDKHWDEIAASSINENSLRVASEAISNLKLDIDRTHKIWKVALNNEISDTNKLISDFGSSTRRVLRQSLKAYKEDYGEVKLTAAQNIDEALVFFNELGILHTKRWLKVGLPGSFANKKWVKFHTDIITDGFMANKIQLIKFHAGSSILGYTYALSDHKTTYLIQTGFAATKNRKLRSGYISHLYAMQFYAANNYQYYDFLPDEENSYKSFFTKPGESIYWILLQQPRLKFVAETIFRKLLESYRKLKQLHSIKQ